MKGVIRGHGAGTTYWIDGVQVTKARFDRAFPDKSLAGCASLVGWKHLESEALAVHPDDVAEATADAVKKGVPTDFNPETGAPIFRSREHRKEYMLRYGFYDRDGGYGDAQRGQSDVKNRDTGADPGYDGPEYESDLGREVKLTDAQKREMDRVIERRIKGR